MGPAVVPDVGPDTPAQALADDLLATLRAEANPHNVAGMARYGISAAGTLGIPMARLRQIAAGPRTLRRTDPERAHAVAALLWASGGHEARILAGLIDVPALVTPAQADAWVADLDSWDTCDQLQHLFAATPFGYDLARTWAGAEPEFVKRAGFVLACTLAVHDKAAPDARLLDFLPLVEREAGDDRPYVRKALNWALRQIGKRSPACHAAAVGCAERVLADAASAGSRWIARDALRELRSPAVLARLGLTGEGAGTPRHGR